MSGTAKEKELKKLTTAQLEELHHKIQDLREHVLDTVQEFGYDANSLVSQTFERDIEREYGRKMLKSLGKEVINKPDEGSEI